MNVLISADASIDLTEIADFIAQDNPDAAFSFVQRLRNRCSQLGPFPNVGRKRDEIRPGLRSAEGDYVILYRVTKGTGTSSGERAGITIKLKRSAPDFISLRGSCLGRAFQTLERFVHLFDECLS